MENQGIFSWLVNLALCNPHQRSMMPHEYSLNSSKDVDVDYGDGANSK
jgi:hypothetical protein